MSDHEIVEPNWAGGCHCRAVRYTVNVAPKFIFACHCTDCQQLSASVFALGMLIDADGLAIDAAERVEYAKTADSGVISRQYFCRQCGTWIYTQKDNTPETIILRPKTLDDSSWVRPIAQIFTASAQPWALLATAFSQPGNVEHPDRLAAAFAESDIRPSE